MRPITIKNDSNQNQLVARKVATEQLLRDAAFVLRVTRHVKEEILNTACNRPASALPPLHLMDGPSFGAAV